MVSRVLEIEDLKVEFPSPHGLVKAVDGIAYTIDPGETVALMRESGCGKSMSALAVLGLVPPPRRDPSTFWLEPPNRNEPTKAPAPAPSGPNR